jgi:hypothetical protein
MNQCLPHYMYPIVTRSENTPERRSRGEEVTVYPTKVISLLIISWFLISCVSVTAYISHGRGSQSSGHVKEGSGERL